MGLGPLKIVVYPIKQWVEAKKFYGEILGLPVVFFGGDELGWMTFGEKTGVQLGLSLVRESDASPVGNNGVLAMYQVDDLIKTVSELRAQGVRCDDPVIIPDLQPSAYFYDPDGNRLQMYEA